MKGELKRIDSLSQSLQDSIAKAALRQREKNRVDSLAGIAKSKPVWGDRMQVRGDFNGDGVQDTLYEQYISLLTGRETNQEYDFEGFDDDNADWIFYWQVWTVEKQPLVRLKSNNPKLKSFDVEKGGAQAGFDYLKNVGDLNGDGTDEIVYYIYDVDMSSLNSCALATYTNGKWKEVYHWSIHEFDFYTKEDGSKPEPVYIKKKNGKVYCREMDWEAGGDYVWKRLKTNW